MAEVPNLWSWIPEIPYIPYWVLLLGYLLIIILISVVVYKFIKYLLEEQ